MSKFFSIIASVTLTLTYNSEVQICSRYCCTKHLCEVISKYVKIKSLEQ